MADYRERLHTLPGHMHEAVVDWIERAEPHPRDMGLFFRAVLSNNLMGAFASADEYNRAAIENWVRFIYNDMPSTCHGSLERLVRWYEAHHEPTEGEVLGNDH